MAAVCRIKIPATLLLCVAILFSCVREPHDRAFPSAGEDVVTSVIHYRAVAGEASSTRASLNDIKQYIFESEDKLYVTSGSDMYGVLHLVAGQSSTIATFEGDLMCLNDFVPTESTPLSAILVSPSDEIHTCSGGKVTATSYPSNDAYAVDFEEAVRRFSDFRADNSFASYSFSLEQRSAFLLFKVTFDDSDGIAANTNITASITNDSGVNTLRTGTVRTFEEDFSVHAQFVASFPETTLSSAAVSFTAVGGDPVIENIASTTLQPNHYYDIVRTHFSADCFTIQAREANTTITYNYTGFEVQYRLSTGGDWVNYNSVEGIVLANEKDYIQFRSKRSVFNTDNKPIFTTDKPVYIYGDIMSLICDNSYNKKTELASNAFRYAFKNTDKIDIPAGRPLILSASTLGSYCYNQMFYGCTSLTRAPELQTTLSADIPVHAYSYMFQGCTSLVSAPEMPSGRSVGNNGYQGMFKNCTALTSVPASIEGTSGGQVCNEMFLGCTSLANAPALPSTSVGNQGYYKMFSGCTSLLQAPDLPATSIGASGYREMFYGCTSLVSAPNELPSTVLTESCYQDMFSGCSSLSQAPEQLPAVSPAAHCYRGMFLNCISLNNGPEIKLTSVGNNSCRQMFSGCTSLVSVAGLNSVESIGQEGCFQMFYKCGELITTPNVIPAGTIDASGCKEMYVDCAKITKAPDIEATSIGTSAFESMFSGCRRLASAPSELLADNVPGKAYYNMFNGCVALSSSPDLSAMNSVGISSCSRMFINCSNLRIPPDLPATTLSTSCYEEMFSGAGIEKAPALPATTLAEKCYKKMLIGCKYLEGPVLLPAPILASECYREMFNGDKLLNVVVCLATDHSAGDCTTNWLKDVSSTGIFVRPSGVSWTLDSASAIPAGWTPQDFGLDPVFPDDPFNPEENF